MNITGNIVDIPNRRIYPGTLHIADGRITSIQPSSDTYSTYLLPGFIDAHVHVESSMLTPSNFAAAAVVHGTVASVSDPHEIANVLGIPGVQFMLDDAAQVPFKFAFGCPSCVPATTFETAGSSINVDQTRQLLANPRISYLSEMMNWPGVLARDPAVMAKIQAALSLNKPVDGHAPGLRGRQAADYHSVGISTDHECFTLDEALDKLAAGAKILIREGSAARNLDALWTLIDSHPGKIMLCSDDKHPNDLIRGHINQLCARLVANGCDLFNILTAACIVPIAHYNLPVGQLRPNDPADFIELSDLKNFKVLRTFINGQPVSENGLCRLRLRDAQPVVWINNFSCQPTTPSDFQIPTHNGQSPGVQVIVAHDGQLITTRELHPHPDPSLDILKIAVINRYQRSPGIPMPGLGSSPIKPALAYIRGFALKRGAIAGSVAHDSHNIIAVGVDDASLSRAVNAVIQNHGGLAVADADNKILVLPLPIAGLMSPDPCPQVAQTYDLLEAAARNLCSPGSPALRSPFMTLSFMALLVIPSLKLSDKGLFDSTRFQFTPLFC